jgi:cation transport ATPase
VQQALWVSQSKRTASKKERKREFPWTVAAERMAKKELALVKRRHSFGAQEGMSARVTSSIRRGQAKSLVLMQEIIAPFIDETRNQQLAEITGSDLGEVQMEKKAKRKLYVSSASLLLISAGILFYAPLYVPGILGLVYIYSSFLKGGYHGLVKEHRINVDALMAAIVTGAFVGGFFFVMALACWYGSIPYQKVTVTLCVTVTWLVGLLDCLLSCGRNQD